ncbi:MAG TPA: hypothetical protein VGY53_01975 [Isosphaeraceae bacterium]|nr:hypothetical protein [Isosphaeraceae bacterium]
MKRKKPRRCRICKKRPIWTRGDVKDPGPACKRCYHKHLWPDRQETRKGASAEAKPAVEFWELDWFHDHLGSPAPSPAESIREAWEEAWIDAYLEDLEWKNNNQDDAATEAL